jgi:hypothetical protein
MAGNEKCVAVEHLESVLEKPRAQIKTFDPVHFGAPRVWWCSRSFFDYGWVSSVGGPAQRVARRYLYGFVLRAQDGGSFYEWAKQKYPEVRNPKRDARKDRITFNTLKDYASDGDQSAKLMLQQMYWEWQDEGGQERARQRREQKDDSGEFRPRYPGETEDNRMEPGPQHWEEWFPALTESDEKIRGWKYWEGEFDDWWEQSPTPNLPVAQVARNPERYRRSVHDLRELYEKRSKAGKLPIENEHQMRSRFERVKKQKQWDEIKPRAEQYQIKGWDQVQPIERDTYEVPTSWKGGDEEFHKDVTDEIGMLRKSQEKLKKEPKREYGRVGDVDLPLHDRKRHTYDEMAQILAANQARQDENMKRPGPQSHKEGQERALLWDNGIQRLRQGMLDHVDHENRSRLQSGLQYGARYLGDDLRGEFDKKPESREDRRNRRKRKKIWGGAAKQLRRTLHHMGVPGFGGRLTREPGSESMKQAVAVAAAFYQEFFDRAGVEALPVIFKKDSEEDGVRTALRFGAEEHHRWGHDVEVPKKLKPKDGEYVEMVPVGELLPMLLLAENNQDVPVPLPARKKELKEEPKQKALGPGKWFRRKASATAVARRYLYGFVLRAQDDGSFYEWAKQKYSNVWRSSSLGRAVTSSPIMTAVKCDCMVWIVGT